MKRVVPFIPLIALALIVVIAAALLLRGGGPAATITAGEAGRPAPTYALARLGGGELLRNEQMSGRAHIINMFASWCVPCRAEHPLLFTLSKDNRIQIEGIAYKNKQSDTNAYLAELGNPYARVAVDESGRTAIDFGLYGVPESYLVDRDGVIRFRQVGPLTEDVIEQKLRPLIAELSK